MKIGDIVQYLGARWKVVSHSMDFRTCILANFESKAEVPDDLDKTSEDLQVLFNPADQWPFVAGPIRSRSGPLTVVSRGNLGLTPFVDWVPSDFLRPGGAIFFNPALRLRQGEVLVGTHQDGSKSRISVTKTFGTLKRRKHLIAHPPQVKGPMSTIDRLLGNDILDED